MKIVTVRRITQVFFLLLFLWFCVVSTFGMEWWRLRGWPVNWFLELDPLVAIGTMLTTHTLYRGLLWALVTVVLTFILGRFFCGWVCPFGTLHQFVGWLGSRAKKLQARVAANDYHRAQKIKYFALIAFLVMAAIPLGESVSLQTGLLDPIPFMHRSVNLILIPIADGWSNTLSITPRQYSGAWLIGGLFIVFLSLNLVRPRFYCRFICPLGALLALFARYSIWRIGKMSGECNGCELCENACEGACDPFGKIRISECLLCMNCFGACQKSLMTYSTQESASGEIANPDFGRRGLILSAVSGLVALPIIRLGGMVGSNWHPRVVRPPGALSEEEFLERCIKCGQCMRVCPTNVIVPGGLDGGIENLWAPVLNFRNGTSGCQLNCTACGHICPTSAIRSFSLAEKLGVGKFKDVGPIRIGTAFVDRSRCLPWAMDTPCIVCQENCPVTPKAIYLKESYSTVRSGIKRVEKADGRRVTLGGDRMSPGKYATGDYCLTFGDGADEARWNIRENTEREIFLEVEPSEGIKPKVGAIAYLQVRLQQPYVDPDLCNGCGICEHECPVSGLRAIRVTAENETRSTNRSLILTRGG